MGGKKRIMEVGINFYKIYFGKEEYDGWGIEKVNVVEVKMGE